MQLKYSKNQNKWLLLAADAMTAIGISVVFVALWINCLGLPWSPKTMFRGNPLKGMLSVWNQLADVLGSSIYLILPRFSGGAEPGGEAMPQGSFLVLMAVFLAILAFLMIRSRVRAFLLVFVIPLLWFTFSTGLAPGVPYMLAFVGVLALAWAQMGGDVFREGTALAVVVLVLGLTVGTGVLVNRFLPLDLSQVTDRTGMAIEKVLHARYGSTALGSGNLNDLSGKAQRKARGGVEARIAVMNGAAKDKTKPALQIKGRELESYYFRGFVGERYRGYRWDRLRTNVYYDARDDLYWLNKSGFDGMSQMSTVATIVNGIPEVKALSVEVKKGDKSQLYIPYEMVGTDKKLPKGSRNYAGGFLGSSRLMGSKSYKLSCGSNMTGTWTDWVGQLYSTGYSPEQTQYFTNESHYNVWCYQKDTEVPAELRDALAMEMGDSEDPFSSHKDYKEAVFLVQDYLAQNFSYTDRFRPLKRKQDFLMNFLTTRKGCDVHYASLATMLFRFYRIPARYVEGYLLTPADVAEGESKVSLGESHLHAWTEIYVDGYGWVPIEVTPEYRYLMDEADMETGLESISYDNMMSEMPPPESDQEEEYQEFHGVRKQLRKIALIVGIALLCLVLLVILAILGRRGWKAWRRNKAFNDPNPKNGICHMYGYMLDEKLPLSETALSLGNAAAFGPYPMGEEHREKMKDELSMAKVKGKRIRKEERKRKLAKLRRDFRRKLRNLKPGRPRKPRNLKLPKPKLPKKKTPPAAPKEQAPQTPKQTEQREDHREEVRK